MTKPPSPAGAAQPCAAPAAVPTPLQSGLAILPPSAYVAGAGIIAADGPGVVVQKLDAAFRKATKAGQVAHAEAASYWRELAARVMDALAEEQERINAECPEHAKCYPSWAHHARRCRWHAEMFRSGKPVGSGAGAPAVLAALAAAPAAVERKALTADALADRCETWLRNGYAPASNTVDAFEAGFRDAEHAHGIGSINTGGAHG